jgi:hypothetical protein
MKRVWLILYSYSGYSTVMADIERVKLEETGNGDRTVRKLKNKLRKSKYFVRKHISEQTH